MSLATAWRKRKNAYRNPVYLAYFLAALLLFWLGAVIAASGAGALEVAIFRAFNNIGGSLDWLMVLFSLPGTLLAVFVVAFIPLVRRHYANFTKVILAGLGSYAVALGLKSLDFRPRPYELLNNVFVRESSVGANGYPSGHVAVATAVAIVMYQYIPRRYHKFLTLAVCMVAVSRLYLGVHFPADLLGGFAVGLAVGSLVAFVIGTTRDFGVKPATIRARMRKLGFPVQTVKAASLDARGSKPYFVELEDGRKLFVKVVGSDNNVADWLFKAWRKVIYRRLEDEVPFFTPKRALEHEAYIAGLAYANNIRTPRIVGVFRVGHNKWAQAQEAIDGHSLDSVTPARVTNKVVDEVWRQVALLHEANIAHRDLRAANVFLDKANQPWLIDFGFSEASVSHDAKIRDNVELMSSLTPLIGVDRSVAAVQRAVGIKGMKAMLPFLSYAVLSSATTKLIKKEKVLPELVAGLQKATKTQDIRLKKMKRISTKNLVIVAAMLIAFYVLLPQIADFKQSYRALTDANMLILAGGFLLSVGTYFTAALLIKLLSLYPLRYGRTLLVQFASTFTNRLLPAGAGNLATTVRYLMKNHHTTIQAGSVAAANNIIGLIGNLILLTFVVIFSKTPLNKVVRVDLPPWATLLILAGLLSMVIAFIVLPAQRRRAIRVIRSALTDLADLASSPFRLLSALSTSVVLTGLYAFTLYACAHALGVELSIIQTFFVFTVGVIAASITPTPGGIGGAEAGLVAGMASVGIPSEAALPVALSYRFLTYWLPIIPGFVAFQVSVRRKYI